MACDRTIWGVFLPEMLLNLAIFNFLFGNSVTWRVRVEIFISLSKRDPPLKAGELPGCRTEYTTMGTP
jgi:hypothetical protein